MPKKATGTKHTATAEKEDPQAAPLSLFPELEIWSEEKAEREAFALLALFFWRRILNHQALDLLYRSVHPLWSFLEMSERDIKTLFAQWEHLRGYVDSSQLVSQRGAALRYAEKQRQHIESMRGALYTMKHPHYPRVRLSRAHLPVHWLFCYPRRAPILPRPVVAIIGSRESNKKQLDAAARVAEGVGRIRGTVITGLATGADAAAHEAAVHTEANVVAVLGSGISKPYPPENAAFVADLLRGRGTLLTEVPSDHTPNEDSFVYRNRIVASLADVVVAVSGKYLSGTAHTVRFGSDANIRLVSVDPTPNSGISKLVNELGGAILTPEQFEVGLEGEDE